MQDSKLRQIVTLGSQDTLEEKTVTVCFGADFVNVSFINFCATRKEIAQVSLDFEYVSYFIDDNNNNTNNGDNRNSVVAYWHLSCGETTLHEYIKKKYCDKSDGRLVYIKINLFQVSSQIENFFCPVETFTTQFVWFTLIKCTPFTLMELVGFYSNFGKRFVLAQNIAIFFIKLTI